jgi:beta-lactamase regulating signal transducer with metallopeptidase domain
MSMPFVELAAMVTERVLNAIPGGLLIAVFVWLLLRVAGHQNSKTRFAVWFGALLAVAGLPFLPSLAKSSAVAQTVRSEIVLPGFWAAAIFSAWILVAALAMTRIVGGLWKLRLLRRSSLPLAASTSLPPASFTPPISNPPIQAVVAQFQRTRGIVVRSSSVVAVPTAIGFFRPLILIPDWVLQELSAEELKVVLLHEFAHLRRFDDWTNLLQKLVRTIFFFHPAVWWIERKLSLEREMACDEVVLAQTENPQAYAECLVSLAEKSFVRRGLALAQAVIGHARDTSLRLARILDGNRLNSARGFRPALGLATVLAACCLFVLPDTPRLIAFHDAAPVSTTAFASAAETAPQVSQTAVVPVSARVTDTRPYPAVARNRVPKVRGERPAMISEAHGRRQQTAAAPVLILAHADQNQASPQPTKITPSQFVFMMQTTHYDERGSAIVRLCVWRVTFDGENRQTVQQETIVRVL